MPFGSKEFFFALVTLSSLPPAAAQQRGSGPIVLVARGNPQLERVTSEGRCGSLNYRISWTNRGSVTSGDFQFFIDDQRIRSTGTDAVEAFLEQVKVVRLGYVSCEQNQPLVRFGLSGASRQATRDGLPSVVERVFELRRNNARN